MSTIELKSVEQTAAMQKSEYCRAMIRGNWEVLNGPNATEARSALVTHMVQVCGLARPLARVYVKENIARVQKALDKAK